MIVLDTHAWVWWVSAPERLSPAANAAIDSASRIGISTMSAWEVAMLHTRGRIELDREIGLWIRQALSEARVEALAPSVEIAISAGCMDAERFPGDPMDRMIYTTAKSAGAKLVTRDTAIREFDPASTIW